MEKLLVTVDAIEGGKAALLLRCPEEERPLAVVPLAMLPEGVAAGDILSLSFHAEPELTGYSLPLLSCRAGANRRGTGAGFSTA